MYTSTIIYHTLHKTIYMLAHFTNMASCFSLKGPSFHTTPPHKPPTKMETPFDQDSQYPSLQSSNQPFDLESGSGSFKNDDVWPKSQIQRRKNQVFVHGYVETCDEEELVRAKSLTDEDLEELKGCLDLGFGFSYDEIPELCNTLPALELCYSMSRKFIEDRQKSPATVKANWKISTPGDDPEDVKARLKFWAQAVACTVKLCS